MSRVKNRQFHQMALPVNCLFNSRLQLISDISKGNGECNVLHSIQIIRFIKPKGNLHEKCQVDFDHIYRETNHFHNDQKDLVSSVHTRVHSKNKQSFSAKSSCKYCTVKTDLLIFKITR